MGFTTPVCPINYIVGACTTHLKKDAQVKLDHETPKNPGENTKLLEASPP